MQASLREIQRIPTSGARAVKSFTVGGLDLLAIPQLAYDVPGGVIGMNAGDSETALLLLRRRGDEYVPHAELPGPGGEDAELFRIGDRTFLAVACIRTGSGPYRFDTESLVYEWSGGEFRLFQKISTVAAKQFKHWRAGDRHFLGLAQGLGLHDLGVDNRDSMIFEWDGTSFVEFQHIPSRWAYNWHPFEAGGDLFVAHADHAGPSTLYRWNSDRYVPHQELLPAGGRAFADFVRDGVHFLVAVSIANQPVVMAYDGGRFAPAGTLTGPGAREVKVVEVDGQGYLIRINFITGTPMLPQPSLKSQIYAIGRGGRLGVVAEFPTSGGTDADVIAIEDGSVRFAVSNGLSGDVRFATESVIYEFRPNVRETV
ncbi:hypothetical protein ACFFX1_06685 [Dactylosporangium sucinum]|uniref:EPTP domain-containing protein n=1 Tax=Dactylosporangium sucinum TaxID=1424081 RepID=A0A917X595_9ACTN|nr:hypothetical protein [Dactylosporangium sucinum]GGM78653.1 hypothetical protein GCM10007977_095310 [Dactylosporangium sucinum]